MPNLVPIGAQKGDALTRDLLQGTAQATLAPTVAGQPRTFFIVQASAGRSDVDDLIDCLLLLCQGEAVLVQAGGVPGPPFKSHMDDLKHRLHIHDPEIEAKLINLRTHDEPARHMIISWDQNLLPALFGLCDVLMSDPFHVPVEIIYVAERNEDHIIFVEHCKANALPVMVAEASSMMNRFSDGRRLIIPAMPSDFTKSRQANGGLGSLNGWLKSAPPGTIAMLRKALMVFDERLRNQQHV